MQEYLQIWLSPFMISLLISTGIGLIVGLEREFNSTKTNYHFAGIRTFPLMAITGCLASLLAQQINTWVVLIAIPSILIFIGITFIARNKETFSGITTELSLFIAFILGVMAGFEFYREALAAGVFTTLLLSLKGKFRQLVTNITEEELFAFIKFTILTLLILPLLPNKDMGPNGVLNPFEIGVVVIIVSTVNFIGYFLVKFIGSGKGLLLTAFLGGIFSSTAVTWVFSMGSRDRAELSKSYAGGIILATTIAFMRVLLLCLIFNAALFKIMIVPCILLTLSGVVFLIFLVRHFTPNTEGAELKMGNPLNLGNAFGFGIIYIGILLMTNYSESFFGNSGFYITGFVSGFADLDATTISAAKLAQNADKLFPAAMVVMLAFLSNSLTKLFIVILRATMEVKKLVLISYSIMAAVGVVIVLFKNLINLKLP
ncbi:MAG: MgtC/SapB family protein [Bacteroidia bacterium]